MTRVPAPLSPLTPDADEARRWAEQELADPAYEAARPTPFDRVAQAIGDAIAQFFTQPVPSSWGPAFAVVATVVVLAVVLVAFLIWGRPRAGARLRPESGTDLFGDVGHRSAAELRADAARYAADEDWTEAIGASVRALARGLDERGILETPPGTTVQSFARQAAASFPEHAAEFASAASDFDDVRYLRRPGTRIAYECVRSLDDAVSRTRVPAGRG
ncbi:DUF4129 domain-containing protein [Microbacterium caowuchunii]|uniref:DUF4129 domain-containing protein n=1 Tax=Microbacterium caowuchunii TaxID=2614638 RepID=A0A5N0T5I0_9MICO|nr:DUF4129 domain-containing protein [Microbacterium caowuchunii]KAA9130112.1 DUF4129 domain-containing protein [Microbacterium caowuchunii]